MNVELSVLHDGGVMMVSSEPLRDLVRRIEYYREQRLFMVIYDADHEEEDLMHYEIPKTMTQSVENAPNIMIYSLFPNHEPIGYKVPLVQIGEMF